MSEAKRFKTTITSFEDLPNELIIETFAYLNGVDAVYAFSHLNDRLQSLLLNYVKVFDFKSISKTKFHYVIQHHHVNQWRSLRLSDDDETPGQIRLFSQLYPPHQYLSQLQSLSVINMTPRYAQEFLSNINSFGRHLVSLKISNICGEHISSLTLPSLKRLILTGCKHNEWIEQINSLESLQYTIRDNCHYDYALRLPVALKQLRLFYGEKRDGHIIRKSLHRLSQLIELAVCDNGNDYFLPNGLLWEELIQSSLPLLQTFQFCFPFYSYNDPNNFVEQTIASFSTPFYLMEKQWFIRCDYDAHHSRKGTLYSLPFAFSAISVNVASFDTSLSTLTAVDMDEKKYESYKKVKTLVLNEKCQIPHRSFLTSNIVRLVLHSSVPTSWHFLMHNVRYLEYKSYSIMSSTDFHDLLSNIPNLQSLKLSMRHLLKLTDNFQNNTVCNQLSQKIQSLSVHEFYSFSDKLDTITVRHLNSLVRIFGTTCKHLSLSLAAHPNTVRPILRRMRQLRSLHIYYRNWSEDSEITAASWIERQTTNTEPSDFMYSTDDNHFYIWFGNRF